MLTSFANYKNVPTTESEREFHHSWGVFKAEEKLNDYAKGMPENNKVFKNRRWSHLESKCQKLPSSWYTWSMPWAASTSHGSGWLEASDTWSSGKSHVLWLSKPSMCSEIYEIDCGLNHLW